MDKINQTFLKRIAKNNTKINNLAIKGEMFDSAVSVPAQESQSDYKEIRAEAKKEAIIAIAAINELAQFT